MALAVLIGAAGPADIRVMPKLIAGGISSQDYPRGAMSRNAAGTTKVRLTISVDGRATGCSILQSSGDAELDWKVCTLATKRMQFSPALTHDGRPVPMVAILPVRWEIDPSSSATPSGQK